MSRQIDIPQADRTAFRLTQATVKAIVHSGLEYLVRGGDELSEPSEKEIDAMKAALRRRYEKYAARKGYRLNPDADVADATLHGLVMRKLKFGKYYCPCKVLTGDPDKDKRLICPCVDHKQEIEENGICTCRLLIAEDYKEE